MYCWSLPWRNLSSTLLVCEMSANVQLFEHSLALLFLGTGMKTEIFQSCGHCWVFQICWHIEYSTFIASSFRIWNRSSGIPSPPLSLFVVMLPKAHLTSHSRMSGSRWVITWKKKERVPENHLFLLYWLCQSLWLCGSQQTVGNSERDGNTRPPDLPLEKFVYRSGSNS